MVRSRETVHQQRDPGSTERRPWITANRFAARQSLASMSSWSIRRLALPPMPPQSTHSPSDSDASSGSPCRRRRPVVHARHLPEDLCPCCSTARMPKAPRPGPTRQRRGRPGADPAHNSRRGPLSTDGGRPGLAFCIIGALNVKNRGTGTRVSAEQTVDEQRYRFSCPPLHRGREPSPDRQRCERPPSSPGQRLPRNPWRRMPGPRWP